MLGPNLGDILSRALSLGFSIILDYLDEEVEFEKKRLEIQNQA